LNDDYERFAILQSAVGSKKVVELYGGFEDQAHTKPYTNESLNTIFSSSKGVSSFVVAHLVDQGHLDYYERVSKYWPEFAAGGKEHVLVWELLAHRAGVAYLDENHRITVEDTYDLDKLAARIAGQPHVFDGKSLQGYAAVTRDWVSLSLPLFLRFTRRSRL
jgi:CubicO group peptidase (beta-lactamase class C family)